MEVEIAKRLWARSEERGIRYTGFLTDGDSKAFDAVVEMRPYGQTAIYKEDCINYAHKRMGTALLNKTKEKKLGGRGQGRLTKEKALKLQYYYRFAVQNNAGDIQAMKDAVFATLFHCMSTDENPHHTRCPVGEGSWCFYQRAVAEGRDVPPHSENVRHPLSYEVAQELVPVYRRMTDPNLLTRLARAKTQNANECFHSVIWSRCPKTIFVGKERLHGAVAAAVGAFNKGASHLTQVMLSLNIEANEVSMALVEAADNLRVTKARALGEVQHKRACKARGEQRKRQRVQQEDEEGVTYAAGHF